MIHARLLGGRLLAGLRTRAACPESTANPGITAASWSSPDGARDDGPAYGRYGVPRRPRTVSGPRPTSPHRTAARPRLSRRDASSSAAHGIGHCRAGQRAETCPRTEVITTTKPGQIGEPGDAATVYTHGHMNHVTMYLLQYQCS